MARSRTFVWRKKYLVTRLQGRTIRIQRADCKTHSLRLGQILADYSSGKRSIGVVFDIILLKEYGPTANVSWVQSGKHIYLPLDDYLCDSQECKHCRVKDLEYWEPVNHFSH